MVDALTVKIRYLGERRVKGERRERNGGAKGKRREVGV